MENNKKKRGNIWIHRIIVGVLVVIIIVSCAGMLKEYLDGKKTEDNYESLASLVQTTEAVTTPEETEETEPETEETTAYVSPIDFDALRAINPDTVGWIKIPDTNVDYPIVWKEGDNDTYLHTDFEGNSSQAGAIYLDMDSAPDFGGRNNIIYGHHMKNGSMFKDVVKYKDKEFFEAHQYFEIYTPERTIHLKAVSSYYDKAQPIVRKTRFKTRESYNAFIHEMLAPCSYAQIPEVDIDSLYILVTCSYEVDDARTFLFAVEVDEDGNVIESEDPQGGFLESPVSESSPAASGAPAEETPAETKPTEKSAESKTD